MLGYCVGERPSTLRRHRERSVLSGFAIGIVERTELGRSKQGQLSQVERAAGRCCVCGEDYVCRVV